LTETRLRRPRWATPDDNEALIALNRACPMHGSIDMYFDRAPDFFALSRLQGDGARVCVVDGTEPGTLDASAAIAHFPRTFLDGEHLPLFYACDLRVHPDRRGGRTVKRIYDFMTEYGKGEGWDLGITTVMKDNAAMAGVLQGKAGIVAYRHVTSLRNFAIQFFLPKARVRGIEVRAATEADLGDMVALWNRVNGQKQFAPIWDVDSLRARLGNVPGYAIGNYRLAFRGDRLVGLIVLWDQEAFKRMMILGYAAQMLRMKRWYNPLSRVLGLAPIPEAGHRMPYLYVTHACAEDPEVLRALLVHAYNEVRGNRYLFISAMVDTRDPLMAAFEGFITNQVDIELFVMDEYRRWGEFDFQKRPAYFDHAIV
jgi:hypothetical protein